MEFIFKRLQTILKNWKMYQNLGTNVLITWKKFWRFTVHMADTCWLFVNRYTIYINEHTLKAWKKLSQDSNLKM